MAWSITHKAPGGRARTKSRYHFSGYNYEYLTVALSVYTAPECIAEVKHAIGGQIGSREARSQPRVIVESLGGLRFQIALIHDLGNNR